MITPDALNAWLKLHNLKDAYSVNDGLCEDFAMDFLSRIPAGEIIGTDNVDGWASSYPGHIWIFDGDLHFDSEALTGVANWRELPIFKRYDSRS